jgi:hypothetical protein
MIQIFRSSFSSVSMRPRLHLAQCSASQLLVILNLCEPSVSGVEGLDVPLQPNKMKGPNIE